MAKEFFNGVGRRKNSTARVYLSDGSGTFIVNKKSDIDSYLKRESLVIHAMKPLEVLNLKDKYDLKINLDLKKILTLILYHHNNDLMLKCAILYRYSCQPRATLQPYL